MFRKIAKDMLWRLASLAGAARQSCSRGALVVGLHRVAPSSRQGGLDCPPQLFDELCKFLARNFTVRSLPQLVRDLKAGRPVGGQAAVTFDDGYRDNLLVAVPILERYSIPATFFITSGFAGGNCAPAWDLKAKDPRPMLNWEDVQHLAARGYDIGGHTRTHPDLARLPLDALREEVLGCREDILAATGVAPVSFAYPFGGRENITREGVEVVRESGFACCCSLYGGMNQAGGSPFGIKRLPFSDWYLTGAHFGGDVLVTAFKENRIQDTYGCR